MSGETLTGALEDTSAKKKSLFYNEHFLFHSRITSCPTVQDMVWIVEGQDTPLHQPAAFSIWIE